MAIDVDRIKTRGNYGILIGVIVLAVAVGLVVWRAADLPWYAGVCASLIVIGVFLVISSFGKESGMGFAPSESSYYFVTGYMLLALGSVGIVVSCMELEWWIVLAAFIALMAVLIVVRSVSKKG